MAKPVRIALIGCGRIAQVAHLPAIEKADGVELVAVSDPNGAVAGAVAQRYNVPAAYTDVSQLLADADTEAVIVAAPDRFHHDITSASLRQANMSWSRNRSLRPSSSASHSFTWSSRLASSFR
jgi:predicted dehydrogenase